MQPQIQPNRGRKALQLGLIALLVVAGLNYQRILDEYALATYKATAEITSFESRIELTRQARATLYRAKPQFDGKTAFNADCDTQPHELELGCFYRGRIFVLKIDNSALAPEMDVVSAHELLHAAWAGMGPKERSELAAELERVYAGLSDKDLADRMAGYARSEPGEESNELHSILGTEFAELSPALEEHYAKYFVNRSQVVAAHAEYKMVFESRRAELERELASIRSEKAQLSVMNRQLDAYRASSQIAAYNALVPKQNALVDLINKHIESYREGVQEYNELSKSLDSQEITETEAPAQ